MLINHIRRWPQAISDCCNGSQPDKMENHRRRTTIPPSIYSLFTIPLQFPRFPFSLLLPFSFKLSSRRHTKLSLTPIHQRFSPVLNLIILAGTPWHLALWTQLSLSYTPPPPPPSKTHRTLLFLTNWYSRLMHYLEVLVVSRGKRFSIAPTGIQSLNSLISN